MSYAVGCCCDLCYWLFTKPVPNIVVTFSGVEICPCSFGPGNGCVTLNNAINGTFTLSRGITGSYGNSYFVYEGQGGWEGYFSGAIELTPYPYGSDPDDQDGCTPPDGCSTGAGDNYSMDLVIQVLCQGSEYNGDGYTPLPVNPGTIQILAYGVVDGVGSSVLLFQSQQVVTGTASPIVIPFNPDALPCGYLYEEPNVGNTGAATITVLYE